MHGYEGSGSGERAPMLREERVDRYWNQKHVPTPAPLLEYLDQRRFGT